MAKRFPLSVIIEAVDRLSGPLRRIGATVSKFQGRIAANKIDFFNDGGFKRQLDVITKSGAEVRGIFGGVAKSAAIMAGAMSLVAAGFSATILSFSNMAGDISDTADRLGIGTEKLQELTYAAKLGGVEAEEFAAVLQKLNINIGKAASGKGKEAADVFAGLGIDPKKITDVSAVLPILADRLNKITNPAKRAAAQAILLGKTGPKLQTLLGLGSKGIQELADRARSLGLVIADKDVRAGEAFGDTIDTLKMTMQGLVNMMGAALLPTLQDLADKLITWFINNRPQIEKFFAEFAEKLPERIDKAIVFLGQLWAMLEGVAGVVDFVSRHIDGFGVALAFLAGAYIATGIFNLVIAIKTLSLALAATPVGWIILAVAALAAGAYLLIKNWDAVKTWWFNFWPEALAAVKNFAVDAVQWVVQNNPFVLLIKGALKLMSLISGIDLEKKFGNMLPKDLQILYGIGDAAGQAFPRTVVPKNPDAPMQPDAVEVQQPVTQQTPADLMRQAMGGKDKELKLTVDFNNLPPGARVGVENRDNAKIELNQGYQFGG